MKPSKNGNKIEDYFIQLTPSKWLVDENHKQIKKKKFKQETKQPLLFSNNDYFSSKEYYRDRHNRKHKIED